MTNRNKHRDAEMTKLSDNDLIRQLYKCYKHARVRDCQNEENKTKKTRDPIAYCLQENYFKYKYSGRK